jgi:hypothetical protein
MASGPWINRKAGIGSILGVRAAILASALAVLGVGIVAVRPLLAASAAAYDPGQTPIGNEVP